MTTWDASPVFQDTFTEASDTTLVAHTPDTGLSWTAQNGTFKVVSLTNKVGWGSSGTPSVYANVSGGVSADMAVEMTTESDNDYGGPLALATSLGTGEDNFSAYAALWFSNSVYLAERIGGTSWTIHASTAVTHTPGDTIRIECDSALTNNISLWTDTGAGFVKKVEIADATLTSGEAGIRSRNATPEAASWGDDFAVYEKAAAAGGLSIHATDGAGSPTELSAIHITDGAGSPTTLSAMYVTDGAGNPTQVF